MKAASVLVTLQLASFCALAQTGATQTPTPTSAEEALRARVKQFYTLQLENKFRAAESCVCEDTRDYYYDLQKKPPRSFDISRIEIDKTSTEAKVITIMSGELATVSGAIQVSLPVPTQWKFENNQWCFFVPIERQKTIQTPFGEIKAGAPAAGSGPQSAGPPSFNPVRVEDLQRTVEASAEAVVFEAAKAAAAEIEFVNSLPGKVRIEPPTSLPPGLRVKLDRTQLELKEKAKVRFEYTPPPNFPAESYVLPFNIDPTRQVILVQVRFERPAATKKAPEFQFPPAPSAIRKQ